MFVMQVMGAGPTYAYGATRGAVQGVGGLCKMLVSQTVANRHVNQLKSHAICPTRCR